jgi:hypothetical protein|eukprot:COSAG06_NODE_1659_length_8780_cov_82.087663_8_plen_48_part_00
MTVSYLGSVEHLASLDVASKTGIKEHPAEGTQPVERSFFFEFLCDER